MLGCHAKSTFFCTVAGMGLAPDLFLCVADGVLLSPKLHTKVQHSRQAAVMRISKAAFL